jgi:hypothetical protein
MNDEIIRRSFFDEIDSTPTASFRGALRASLLDTWNEPDSGHDALSEADSSGQRPRRRVLLLAAAVALIAVAGIVVASRSGGDGSVRTGTVPATTPPPPASSLPTLPPTVVPSTATQRAPTTAPPSSGPPPTAVVPTSAAASIEAPTIVESNMTWTARAVQGDVADLPASTTRTVFGTGPLVLEGHYLSEDGVTWHRLQPALPDMSMSLDIRSADAADGRVVLLANTYDPDVPHGEADVVVLTSDDGGRDWTTLPFRSDTNLPPEPTRTILTIDDVVVVTWGTPETGRTLFVSTAGAPFEPVETPQSIRHIARSSDEFLVIDDHMTMWSSENGVDWTEVGPTPPGLENQAYAFTFGKVGDLYAIVEPLCLGTGRLSRVWLSANGTEWVASDLGGLIGPDAKDGMIYGSGNINHYLASITDAGITLVAIAGSTARADQIEHDVDPTLAAADEPTDTETARGVCRYNPELAATEVLDTNGNVRATLTHDPETNVLLPPVSADLVVLHSDDGIRWSSTSINELTDGYPSYPVWITTIAGSTSIGLAPQSAEGNPPFATVTVLNSDSPAA